MSEKEFPEEAVNQFLRTATTDFSLKKLTTILGRQGLQSLLNDLFVYIRRHPLVFSMGDDRYITRSGVFTNKFFSIKPTKTELSLGILIPGHRCMPFADPEMYPHELNFINDEVPLEQRTESILLSDVFATYALYGEEYIPQFIALDPANGSRDFSKTDYELPPTIDLTVWDMNEFYAQWNFTYGDRILARVVNWDLGDIELSVLKVNRSTPFEITADDEVRNRWFADVEQSFEKGMGLHGPLSSIEEQLAYTFFGSTDTLCIPQCCSIEEYLKNAKEIGIEDYGVESRLWKKGKEIPAVGIWNGNAQDSVGLADTLYEKFGIPIPAHILDAYIYDALYRKEKKTTNSIKRIVPEACNLDKVQMKMLSLHLKMRYDMLLSIYNRFLDFEKGPVRSQALGLYSSLVELICELDVCDVQATTFPQQPLVTLAQLFSHTTHLIEIFLDEGVLSKQDLSVISTSLEGMNENFEEIAAELAVVVGNKKKDGFTIV